jgi:hypothetical protein
LLAAVAGGSAEYAFKAEAALTAARASFRRAFFIFAAAWFDAVSTDRCAVARGNRTRAICAAIPQLI